MPYYPKNRIQTNLYTNGGEYLIKSTGQEYTGYYYKLYNNTLFTGKTPNDTPNQQLIPFEEVPDITSRLVIVEPFPSPEVLNYSLLNESPDPKIVPSPYYPQPSESDYNLGEFQRYFMKQINALSFTEISKTDYNSLLNKKENYLWQLYIPVSIPWEISGNKDQVQKTNQQITVLTEQQNKFFGFTQFIQKTGGYLKYYQ